MSNIHYPEVINRLLSCPTPALTLKKHSSNYRKKIKSIFYKLIDNQYNYFLACIWNNISTNIKEMNPGINFQSQYQHPNIISMYINPSIMKPMLLLIISTLMLITNFAQAQNCPATPTYKNVDGTFDFTASNLSYVVNNGSSRNVTISKDLSSTSTICVLNGSTLNLSFALSGSSAILPGATIYINATSKLEFKGTSISKFPFTIINNGTLVQSVDIQLRDGAAITNNGTFNANKALSLNEGFIKFENNGNITFADAFSFTDGALSFKNSQNATITFKGYMQINNAYMINNGTLSFEKNAILKTSTLYNTNSVTVNGGSSDIFQCNKDTIINYGNLTSRIAMEINSDGVLVNYCKLYGYKSFQNNSYTENIGSILLDQANSACSFRNNGTFINGEVGFVQANSFSNSSGSITGGGDFYIKGTSSNGRIFEGTSGSKPINFYDATPCLTCGPNRYFDNQSTDPKFTTKTIVLPLALTLTTPCGEPAPPAIISQPVNAILCDVSSTKATFSVSATTQYTAMTFPVA